MDSKQSNLITIPIDGRMIAKAEKISLQHRSTEKSRQSYLNTLAVLAVDFYCKCIDIETDIPKSSGLNNILNSLLDTAGLFIKHKGLLECLPVLPKQDECYIPPEVKEGCIGYMGVEINEVERKATILGFIKSVHSQRLLLTSLQPLEDFLFYLHKLQQPSSINVKLDIENTIVQLSKWFDGLFDLGWQSELAVAKSIAPINTINVTKRTEITGAKIIKMTNLSEPVLLILHQLQVEDEVEIVLRVYPASESIFLIDGIKMTLLDIDNHPIPRLENVSKSSNWLQLRFKGNVGDKFGLKLSLDTEAVVEQFVI